MGFRQFVGLYAVFVRCLELVRQLRLGMGSGDGRLLAVVGRRRVPRRERRDGLWWLSSADATTPAARAGTAAIDRGQSALDGSGWLSAGAGQDFNRRYCRLYDAGPAAGESAPHLWQRRVWVCESRRGVECGRGAGGRAGSLGLCAREPGWSCCARGEKLFRAAGASAGEQPRRVFRAVCAGEPCVRRRWRRRGCSRQQRQWRAPLGRGRPRRFETVRLSIEVPADVPGGLEPATTWRHFGTTEQLAEKLIRAAGRGFISGTMSRESMRGFSPWVCISDFGSRKPLFQQAVKSCPVTKRFEKLAITFSGFAITWLCNYLKDK